MAEKTLESLLRIVTEGPCIEEYITQGFFQRGGGGGGGGGGRGGKIIRLAE